MWYEQFVAGYVKGAGVALTLILFLIFVFWAINRAQRHRAALARAREENLRFAVRWEAYDRAEAQIVERELRLRDERIFNTVREFYANPN